MNQGLAVGWTDIYSLNLPGQEIDITDVPDGDYWLASEVDPDNKFCELNDDNNVARVRVTIGAGSPATDDRYEPNDTTAEAVSVQLGRLEPPVRKRRLYGLLARRGFYPDTIDAALRALPKDLGEPTDN